VIPLLLLCSFSYYEDDTQYVIQPALPEAIPVIPVYNNDNDSRIPRLPESIPYVTQFSLPSVQCSKYVNPTVVEEKVTPKKPVPEWVLKGILMTESSSYYRKDGSIKYVNRTTGSAGDSGPFQMKKCAFDDVDKKGEKFSKLKTDTKFAEKKACDYLLYLYNNFANRNWDKTIMMYNQGIKGYKSNMDDALTYLNNVKVNAKKK
jgi:hypothetical protein